MPDCPDTGTGVGAPTGKGKGVDVEVDVVPAAGVPVGVVVLVVPEVRFEAGMPELKCRPVPPHPEIIEVAAESATIRTILGTRMLRLSMSLQTKPSWRLSKHLLWLYQARHLDVARKNTDENLNQVKMLLDFVSRQTGSFLCLERLRHQPFVMINHRLK